MIEFIKIFIPTLIFYFIVDYLWIGIIASKFYSEEFGSIVNRSVSGVIEINKFAGLFAYLFLVLGLILFVLPRIQGAQHVWQVAVYGLIFGIVVYGVYDMTNLATLKGFGYRLALIDMLWGGFVCSLCSLFMYYYSRLIH